MTDSSNSTLPQRILDLCEQGLLPVPFRVSDVRRYLGDQYADSYIRRALVLYTEKPQDYTFRWNKPRFRKVRHGFYEVVR